MKYLVIVAAALTLTGCVDSASTPLIPLDDPRRAEQDARHVGTLYGASGIAGIAYIGGTRLAMAQTSRLIPAIPHLPKSLPHPKRSAPF